MLKPKYPVYVISKGRADTALTPAFLIEDNVPFKLVVEPQEAEAYAEAWGAKKILTLPFSNLGQGSIPARNWVWEHAKASGAERHWILDDNITSIMRWYDGMRIKCDSGPAFRAVEDFTDRYENIGISGMNYAMFGYTKKPPFHLNAHVYSCILIKNDLPHRWRGRYNEDTDLCLQVLADNWCTVLVNVFLAQKMQTMVMKGGNTDKLYEEDGRTTMARSLERQWPYVVSTKRRWGRAQHVIKDQWKRFDTPLIRRKDIDFSKLGNNEYGLGLTQVADEVKSETVQNLLKEKNATKRKTTKTD
jgi:hypothetical protein